MREERRRGGNEKGGEVREAEKRMRRDGRRRGGQ